MTTQQLIRNLNILEGRFTVDDGGPTECGITQSSWDPYCRLRGLPPSSVENITPADEEEFYRFSYIDPLLLGDLQNGVDFVLFQWAINHDGSGDEGGSVKTIQICAGVEPDAIMGPETVKAANQMDRIKLMECMLNRQLDWYKGAYAADPSLPLEGWKNRIAKTRKIVGLTDPIPGVAASV